LGNVGANVGEDMFWKKQNKNDSVVLLNPLYAIAYGEIHNNIVGKLFLPDFEEYIKDIRVVQNIENIFNDTKEAVFDLGGHTVFDNVLPQLFDILASKIDEHEVLQIGHAFNVARDVIFAFAPAISTAHSKNVHDLSSQMLSVLIYNLKKTFSNGEATNMISILSSIKVTAQHVLLRNIA